MATELDEWPLERGPIEPQDGGGLKPAPHSLYTHPGTSDARSTVEPMEHCQKFKTIPVYRDDTESVTRPAIAKLKIFLRQPFAKRPDPNRLRQDLPLQNSRCFMLHNLLTKDECEHYIGECEKLGFEDLGGLFPERYRKNDRVLVLSEEFAQHLWLRIEPFVERKDVLRIRPTGFGNGGTWKPYRLNECLKFSRYAPGGHFSPHMDGPWVPREDESSIYTVIVYLNSDFEGGHTRLYHSGSDITPTVAHDIRPRTGSALIFTHDTLHDATAVTELEGSSQNKYILRTEMMFQKVDSSGPQKYKTSSYFETFKIYQDSQKYEREGQQEKFVSAYAQVLRGQCEAQRSVAKNSEDLNDLFLPLDLLLHCFRFLHPRDLAAIMRLSHDWYDVCRDGTLWRLLYISSWPAYIKIEKYLSKHHVLASTNPHTQDWYTIFKQRFYIENYFLPITIDFGSATVKFALCRNGKYTTHSLEPFIRYSEQPHHYRVDEWDRYVVGKEATVNVPMYRPCRTIVENGIISDTANAANLMHYGFLNLGARPQLNPMIIAEPPELWGDYTKKTLKDTCFRRWRCPAMIFVNSARLALLYHRLLQGIVVCFGDKVSYLAFLNAESLLFVMHLQEKGGAKSDPPSPEDFANAIKNRFEYWKKEECDEKFGDSVPPIDDSLAAGLLNNIVITGGKTIGDFDGRFRNVMDKHFPSSYRVMEEPQFATTEKAASRLYGISFGGCQITSLSHFQQLFKSNACPLPDVVSAAQMFHSGYGDDLDFTGVNHYYYLAKKDDQFKYLQQLLGFAQKNSIGTVRIFCNSFDSLMELKRKLQDDFKVFVIHDGMSFKLRQGVFHTAKIAGGVLLTTDVPVSSSETYFRLTIHYGAPKRLEQYRLRISKVSSRTFQRELMSSILLINDEFDIERVQSLSNKHRVAFEELEISSLMDAANIPPAGYGMYL